MTDTKRRVFETKEEAWEVVYEIVGDDPCVDNQRFAYHDDAEAMAEYEEQSLNGCCGSVDLDVTIAGRAASIGCNYGH